MEEKIASLRAQLQADLAAADTAEAVSALKVKYVGRKGAVTELMRGLGALDKEARKTMGKAANLFKGEAMSQLEGKEAAILAAAQEKALGAEKIDVTLPGKANPAGALHPLTQVYHQVRDIFTSMGFNVVEGPEVEYDKYNFEMLNIPKDHPARDIQDTFYISEEIVLRTHTSPMQVRTMLRHKPPIRILCPGRTYRVDDVDATHSPVFNQIEGLYVDKGVTLADLKGVLNTFFRRLYGAHVKTRFRPGFFPFTEPSAEVDATCPLCGGKGCPACKGAGMLELLGCGVVNPVVLKNCGIDPDVYSGFAFGMGLDRLTNLKHGVTDIRLLFENDVRFLRQFV